MRGWAIVLAAALVVAAPGASYALGLELAVGGWLQAPSGTVSYSTTGIHDELDLERDSGYDTETRVMGRAKLDMPLFLPNIYLMATPMEFEGTGRRDMSFTFGGTTYSANVDYYSKVGLDHYDVALYYGLPFLETATMGKAGAEVGLNVRIIDFSAVVTGTEQGSGQSRTETKDLTLPLPMIYAAARISPVEMFSVEAEARGVAYGGNHYYDFIGRLRVRPAGPFFVAGGYRYENVKIDEDDVLADIEFSGPFFEAGLEF